MRPDSFAPEARTPSIWTGNLTLIVFLSIYVSAFWWAKNLSSQTALILGILLGIAMIAMRVRSREEFPFDKITGWLNLGTMFFLAAQAYDHFYFPRGTESLLGDNTMVFGCSAGAVMLAGLSLFHFRLIK
jgi:hypothetical protein